MGRLKDLTARTEQFSHRVFNVVEVLIAQRRLRRLVEQLAASGTSVGANVCEADEALSDADFCKSLGIAVKELVETQFWLRFVSTGGWIKAIRLQELQKESQELKRIVGSIITRTRRRGRSR